MNYDNMRNTIATVLAGAAIAAAPMAGYAVTFGQKAIKKAKPTATKTTKARKGTRARRATPQRVQHKMDVRLKAANIIKLYERDGAQENRLVELERKAAKTGYLTSKMDGELSRIHGLYGASRTACGNLKDFWTNTMKVSDADLVKTAGLPEALTPTDGKAPTFNAAQTKELERLYGICKATTERAHGAHKTFAENLRDTLSGKKDAETRGLIDIVNGNLSNLTGRVDAYGHGIKSNNERITKLESKVSVSPYLSLSHDGNADFRPSLQLLYGENWKVGFEAAAILGNNHEATVATPATPKDLGNDYSEIASNQEITKTTPMAAFSLLAGREFNPKSVGKLDVLVGPRLYVGEQEVSSTRNSQLQYKGENVGPSQPVAGTPESSPYTTLGIVGFLNKTFKNGLKLRLGAGYDEKNGVSGEVGVGYEF